MNSMARVVDHEFLTSMIGTRNLDLEGELLIMDNDSTDEMNELKELVKILQEILNIYSGANERYVTNTDKTNDGEHEMGLFAEPTPVFEWDFMDEWQ